MPWTYIYSLKDPRTGETRYVGKADNPARRLQGHLKHPSKALRPWRDELSLDGLAPVMERIATVPFGDCFEWEKTILADFRASGYRLLNANNGGGGLVTGAYQHTLWARLKIGAAARERGPRPINVREKISEAQKGEKNHRYGKSFTEAQRQSRSQILREKKIFKVGEVIQKIVKLRTAGWSFEEISEQLNESGIPSPYRVKWNRKTVSTVFRRAN